MPAIQTVNKPISTLFTFTPRQVLLGSSTMKHNNDDKTTCNGAVGLKPEQKFLLHKSIANYLELSGFKRTLKKFCSEAQVEKDNLEGLVIDLEEMCLKYLDICKEAKAKINNQKEQGEHLKKDGDENLIADTENAGKKKKRSDKSDNEAVVHQSGTDSKNSEEKEKKKKRNDKNDSAAVHQSGTDSKNSEEKDNDNKCKEKKKKKSKLASESPSNNVEDLPRNTEEKLKDDVSANAKTVIGAQTEKKSKDKKKKKGKPGYDSTVSEKDSSKTSKEELTEKENKDSKKRKRLASEENDTQLADRKEDEESKRRKIEDLNESKGGKQFAQINGNLGSNLNVDKENVGENGLVGGDQLQKSSSGKLNGDLEKTGEKSSMSRSQKKQQNSVEKKEVKAFQRVKLDEVAYADERLQDNSYWAKDGAEMGYGAKAEEVLGQVRGRDFRHEKTKKKRGSYRGGTIDLQSHSVKFNYSDDE